MVTYYLCDSTPVQSNGMITAVPGRSRQNVNLSSESASYLDRLIEVIMSLQHRWLATSVLGIRISWDAHACRSHGVGLVAVPQIYYIVRMLRLCIQNNKHSMASVRHPLSMDIHYSHPCYGSSACLWLRVSDSIDHVWKSFASKAPIKYRMPLLDTVTACTTQYFGARHLNVTWYAAQLLLIVYNADAHGQRESPSFFLSFSTDAENDRHSDRIVPSRWDRNSTNRQNR